MRIDLGEYEGHTFPEDPQKQIIYRLIMQLRYYIKAPLNELNTALPELEALEKQCQAFDDLQGKYKINYIMDILSALHGEQKNDRRRYDLSDDQESLFWTMLMAFKEKIVKIKAVGKIKLIHYRL
jgi:hypothetical protein